MLGAGAGFSEGSFSMALVMTVFAAAAAYSVWVLTKLRHFLSAEASLERELRIERLKEEIDTLKANNKPEA